MRAKAKNLAAATIPKPSAQFVSTRVPLYYQLEILLREKINSGAYTQGDQLPTEDVLIAEYGVSRITVRQALSALADEGLIERRQGRGTFIAERQNAVPQFEGTIHLTGSLNELILMGQKTPVKVLARTLTKADAQTAELLGVEIGEPVSRVERLRLLDDKPYALLVNYFPAEIGVRLTLEDLSEGSVLEQLERKCGLRLQKGIQQITAALADPYVAGRLEIPVGSALLSIENTVYCTEGKPVEYVRVLYRSDLYRYRVLLTREENDHLARTALPTAKRSASTPRKSRR
jgi:GntR family transcriptional regulator